MNNKINLVDSYGKRIGSIDKLEAHVKGQLHEAFSIFIFNSKNELLLQQRAKEKYHSGGLWSNTVCSHPNVGEDLNRATQRRLNEEMGFSVPTNELFSFVYKSDYENGLSEHEFDHVLMGHYDSQPVPNQKEVMNYKWMNVHELKKDVESNPDNYTTWFKKIFENRKFEKMLESKNQSVKNKIINIIGQIRIYSLIDLMLFAYAIGANKLEIVGIVLLHLSFLFYLEYTHKHSYRLPISEYIWIIGGLVGIFLYPKLSVVGFIFSSMLYVRKNKTPFSFFSPLARGFQYYFLAAGVLGFSNPVAFLALVLMLTRNFAGDLRDVVRDRDEKMKTLPIVFGLYRDYKKMHISILFLSSFVWWYISGISLIWLICIYLIQASTYNITPRK